jgi:hypothetical protein
LEIKNAIIRSTKIENERGLSAWLTLDYGGMGQGFGGYMLKGGNANYGGHFIARCLDIGGVDEWSKLVGKAIRVRIEDGLIKAVGHIIEDDWFCPKDEFAKLAKSSESSGV